MKLFLGVTDTEWCRFLAAQRRRLQGEHNTSQVPVMASRTVLGVFSYRAPARRW
jgi:hypothetical protein